MQILIWGLIVAPRVCIIFHMPPLCCGSNMQFIQTFGILASGQIIFSGSMNCSPSESPSVFAKPQSVQTVQDAKSKKTEKAQNDRV